MDIESSSSGMVGSLMIRAGSIDFSLCLVAEVIQHIKATIHLGYSKSMLLMFTSEHEVPRSEKSKPYFVLSSQAKIRQTRS